MSRIACTYYIKSIDMRTNGRSGTTLLISGSYWDSSMSRDRSHQLNGVKLSLVNNVVRGIVPKRYGSQKLVAAISTYLKSHKLCEGRNVVDRRFVREK